VLKPDFVFQALVAGGFDKEMLGAGLSQLVFSDAASMLRGNP